MNKLTVFYLANCPYCIKAKQAVSELAAEDPRYAKISLDWIEESENPAIADTYDYYRVPTIFDGNTKLYECDPAHDYETIKLNFKKAFDSVLGERPLRVLLINGSPRPDGNTSIALNEMVKIFDAEGVESEVVRIGHLDVRGCIACGTCHTTGSCVFNDIVNELSAKFEAADGLVVASPVYFASANATLIACLDRLFYSSHFDTTMKVGAGVAVARRGGCSATFDELNKYFTISNMPVAPSQYWNSVHGRAAGEAEQDLEGLQTMRVLARNMVFMMRGIALAKEKYGLPETEEWIPTHFI